MTIAAIIVLLTSVSKAVPIVDKWVETFVAAYIAQKKQWIKKENHEAIKKSMETGDQRPVEEAMGSTRTGEISGIPGTSVVDSLPGVGMHK